MSSANMADIEDDDAPPDLVDVSALPALEKPRSTIPTAAAVDTPPQSRVPITIVTGIYMWLIFSNLKLTPVEVISVRAKLLYSTIF